MIYYSAATAATCISIEPAPNLQQAIVFVCLPSTVAKSVLFVRGICVVAASPCSQAQKTCWGSAHQQGTLLCSCKYLHDFLRVSDALLAFPCLSTACNNTLTFDCAASTDMSAVRADFSCVAKTSVRSGWQHGCPQQTRGLKGTLLAQTLLTSCHRRISCCMSMPLVQQQLKTHCAVADKMYISM